MTTGFPIFVRIEVLLRYLINTRPIAENRVQKQLAERSGPPVGDGMQGGALSSADVVSSAAAVSASAASARLSRPSYGSRRTNCSVEYTRSNLG